MFQLYLEGTEMANALSTSWNSYLSTCSHREFLRLQCLQRQPLYGVGTCQPKKRRHGGNQNFSTQYHSGQFPSTPSGFTGTIASNRQDSMVLQRDEIGYPVSPTTPLIVLLMRKQCQVFSQIMCRIQLGWRFLGGSTIPRNADNARYILNELSCITCHESGKTHKQGEGHPVLPLE